MTEWKTWTLLCFGVPLKVCDQMRNGIRRVLQEDQSHHKDSDPTE